MVLFSFRAALLLLQGAPLGRAAAGDESLVELQQGLLREALEVYEQALGPGSRSQALLEQRLQQGHHGYLLRKGSRPVCGLWVARHQYDIYPLRTRLQLGPATVAVFDEATVPDRRRQGLLGVLLGLVWDSERWATACCCIRQENAASLAASRRLGFRLSHDLSCRHLLGWLRRHEIRAQGSSEHRIFWSLGTLWENPRRLSSDLSADGFRPFLVRRFSGRRWKPDRLAATLSTGSSNSGAGVAASG